jgi:Fe-S oxidoreductase
MAENSAFDPKGFAKTAREKSNARLKMWMEMCAHCGLCSDTCHFYLANERDPKMIPAYKSKKILEAIKKKDKIDEATVDELYDTVYGECTMCRRCTMYCPFGIDVASIVASARSLCNSQGKVPEHLLKAVTTHLESGNQMAVTREEWVDTLEWMEEELQEELPGATIPIDKKGANVLYVVNAREPKFYPMDISQAAMVFYLAGEDWTMSSKGWDVTNLAMFMGDTEGASTISQMVRDAAEELEVRRVVVTECGHALRSLQFESPIWLGRDHKFEVVHSVLLFSEYLREGRIKLDKSVFANERCTYQDPCNVSRNGGLARAGREVVKYLTDDFVEMEPHGEYNFCCGGGGGFIPMAGPFRDRRLKAGKVKAEQIRATGATICITPCHNCYDQLRDLNKEYDLGIRVLSFKEMFEQALIIPDELKAKEDDGE